MLFLLIFNWLFCQRDGIRCSVIHFLRFHPLGCGFVAVIVVVVVVVVAVAVAIVSMVIFVVVRGDHGECR